MDATVWASSGKRQLGVRVGPANRSRYFSPQWKHILVELDGELRQFNLTPIFWNHCPEFRDSSEAYIKMWLSQRGLLDWPKGRTPRLVLQPLDGNRFRLSVQ